MKRILKVILISLSCVIGALGLAIGGMYLFGGFDEKIVFAEELHFSTQERVSSQIMYMQINTSTEGVTQRTLKLVASPGGERIIDFPENVKIGETFTIIPRLDENNVNMGGNVTLTAFYDSPSANVSVNCKCEILIDIPVTSFCAKLSNTTMKPNQIITVYNKDAMLTDSFNIAPQNSLVPYAKSGTKKVQNLTDKVVYLELVDAGGQLISTNIAQFQLNSDKLSENRIKVNYSLVNNQLVLNDSLFILSKTTQTDVYLKSYVYSTYKQQEENTTEDGSVVLNTSTTLNDVCPFTIGNYEISNMQITPSLADVYLYEDTKIYLNNPDVKGHDINLGIVLSTDSPDITVSDYYIIDNTYITINKSTYRSLTKANGDTLAQTNGLSAKYEGVSTQKNEWYWVLNVNNFNAYYDYKKSGEMFTVTITYNDGINSYARDFNICPKAYEIDSLEINYPEGESEFSVKSGEKKVLTSDDVKFVSSLPSGVTPTFTSLAYYISYERNYRNGSTTICTVPDKLGKYKATFSFTVPENFTISNLSTIVSWGNLVSAVFKQGSIEYAMSWEGGTPPALKTFEANKEVSVEVILNTKLSTLSGDAFYISISKTQTGAETININASNIKFYEVYTDNTTATFPYLSIDNVKYCIDFDFYTNPETSLKYLKIINNISTPETHKVQGIGSFYIDVQLVYNDVESDACYWLGKSTFAKINVYEELTTLYAYKYLDDKADSYFGVEEITYSEDDSEKHYIYLTSDEIESLKNYVYYNQVNISFAQDFGTLNIANYAGIKDINAGAITFGDKWVEVLKDGNVVGYKIYYEINPISTIKIGGLTVQNTFKITVSINVNGTIVLAQFKLAEEENNNTQYLSFNIEDKTITSASITCDGTTGGKSKTDPIELKAEYNNGSISWGSVDLEKLKYFFKYNQDDTSGIFASMTYDLTVEDNSMINLNNLYDCSLKFEEDSGWGKGGLTLYNFPVYAGLDGKNQGVLLRFKVYSLGVYDFNSHYEWDSSLKTFVKAQNQGLEDSLYFKVYGLNIKLESQEVAVDGFKDNQVKLIDNDGGIFKITVTTYAGVPVVINDYSTIMTLVANSDDVSLSNDYKTLTVKKDLINSKNVLMYAYIGSNANRLGIVTGKNGEDDVVSQSYSQKIEGSFNVEVNKNFTSPSKDQDFAKITYISNEAQDISELLNVSVMVVSHTLSADAGVETPITVKDNKLTFKTVSYEYTAVISLSLTLKTENGETQTTQYTITVTPSYNKDSISLGTYDEENSYYYMTAGSENMITASYAGLLLENASSVLSTEVSFSNKDEKDTLLATSHMSKIYGASGIQIWSDDLNYTKEIVVSFVFTFDDGGRLMFDKLLTIKPNITIDLKRTEYNVGANNTINLTDNTNYLLSKINSSLTEIDFSADFNYSDTSAKYNKNSFLIQDSNLFSDISSSSGDNYILQVKEIIELAGQSKQTTIVFYYVTDSGYKLAFNLKITIKYPDFNVNVKTDFTSPSQDQEFVKITYSNDSSVNVDDLLTVLVKVVSHTLPADAGVETPITVKDNKLTFKAVSYEYTAVISLSITLKAENSETKTTQYTITVTPSYTAKSLQLGTYDEKNSVYYLVAGSDNATSVTYTGLLQENAGTITNTDVSFSSNDESDTTPATSYMNKEYSSSGIKIWASEISEAKVVKVSFVISFSDGGKLFVEKLLTVKPNTTV